MQALEQLVALRSHDAEFMAWKLATESTGAYINKNLFSVRMFRSPSATPRRDVEGRNALLDHALRSASVDGLYLQCGVRQGRSINFLSKVVAKEQIIHGFDSFETLPGERLFDRGKQEFSLGGELPRVNPNVRLHKGLLDHTLPDFLKEHSQPVAFLYIDADDYSSNQTILGHLKHRFAPGTVIVIEDYFNFPGWEQSGYKAFQECIAGMPFQYEYIGCASRHYSVAVKLFPRT